MAASLRLWDVVYGDTADDAPQEVHDRGAAAAFIFCSMHFSTTSARLSSGMSARPFSVAIQHSRAARVWVIGSSSGLVAGSPAATTGAPALATRSVLQAASRGSRRTTRRGAGRQRRVM